MAALTTPEEAHRARALLDAQQRAQELFDAVGAEGIIRPGVTDREASAAIRQLAAERFGVARHWHKRIVRSGPNTLRPYQDDPPDRTMTEDDIAFADFGPVFDGWEADFGRTWVIGADPTKVRLRDDLAEVFANGRAAFEADPAITGAELYAHVVAASEERGWRFGNHHCGHLVGEFPHENFDGARTASMITAANERPMRRDDPSGRFGHWILEVHLIDPDHQIGGFYEQLLTL